MKRFLAFTLFVFLTVLGHAQGTMNIYQANGSVLLLSLDNIDSVTYQLAPPPPLMLIHQPGGSVLSLVVADIDSITYSGESALGTPQLMTLPPVNPTSSSVQCGGYISDNAGSPVLVRGVCWSTAPVPTLSDNTTTDGPGSGTFISTISGLTPNTTYFARAYAVNDQGVAYGNLVAFATLASGGQPTLTTTAISGITALTAQSGGTILTDGGETILARGVCWSTDPGPTTANSLFNSGSGVGSFSSDLSGLTENTTYFVRAWATNIYGTGYGDELSFITLDGVPVLTTEAAVSIELFSAISGGLVTNDGGAAITARGVCWSTDPDPTTVDSVTNDGIGMGSFTSYLTGLRPNTTYYLRAYAMNAITIAYGPQVQFTTRYYSVPGAGVIDIEGNSYATIILNNGQEWMAENLRTATYPNGDPIPNVTDNTAWTQLNTGAWAHYNNDSQYEIPYGKLYNWYGASACPVGWHLPSDAEWRQLELAFGMTVDELEQFSLRGALQNVGGVMMGTTLWNAPNDPANNESGFSGYPGGARSGEVGDFSGMATTGHWWSSEIWSFLNTPYNRSLLVNEAGINRFTPDASIGFSVRCVRD